ncbi:MAG: hypothetical protein DMG59_23250, partial [Acidobacteria bacterium]
APFVPGAIFAGLTPGQVGLYQINVRIPNPLPVLGSCSVGAQLGFPYNTVLSNLTIDLGGVSSFDGAAICVQPSQLLFLRTHEEIACLAREHDRMTGGVDTLLAEVSRGLAQTLPGLPQVFGETFRQGRLGSRAAVVRVARRDPLLAVVTLPPGCLWILTRRPQSCHR